MEHGIGKSHLAMSIVKEVKKKGYTALFIDVTELITAYRDACYKNIRRYRETIRSAY
ncbi:hypothetical protein ACWTWI_06470 [Staphylococcus hominis]